MNPTALITGSSRGIGRGIALTLAPRGWDLVINYAGNAPAAEQTVRDCRQAAANAGRPIRVVACRADIASSGDREALVEFTWEQMGRLDLLVNNAGIAPAVRADLLEASEESFDRLLATNLKGPFLLTQRVARRMIEQTPWPAEGGVGGGAAGEAGDSGDAGDAGGGGARGRGRGQIVFVSSISAYTASVNRGDYCVSKAGVAMLTKLFAARLAEHGVGVFEVRPGIIATDMTGPVRDKYDRLIEGGLTPIRRWGTPADVGRAVAAIAEGWLPFSTGEVINVDGGFHLRVL